MSAHLGPAGNPPGNPSDDHEDPDFWDRVCGEEVVARVGDISAAAEIEGETRGGEPSLRVTSATRHTPDGCVDIDVTPEVLALVLPALIEEARELAMGAA